MVCFQCWGGTKTGAGHQGLNIPVLSGSGGVDWHFADRYGIISLFDMCGCVVKNENMIVVGVMLSKNIYSLGDLGNHIIVCKIAITTCTQSDQDTSRLGPIRRSKLTVVGRDKVSNYK